MQQCECVCGLCALSKLHTVQLVNCLVSSCVLEQWVVQSPDCSSVDLIT